MDLLDMSTELLYMIVLYLPLRDFLCGFCLCSKYTEQFHKDKTLCKRFLVREFGSDICLTRFYDLDNYYKSILNVIKTKTLYQNWNTIMPKFQANLERIVDLSPPMNNPLDEESSSLSKVKGILDMYPDMNSLLNVDSLKTDTVIACLRDERVALTLSLLLALRNACAHAGSLTILTALAPDAARYQIDMILEMHISKGCSKIGFTPICHRVNSTVFSNGSMIQYAYYGQTAEMDIKLLRQDTHDLIVLTCINNVLSTMAKDSIGLPKLIDKASQFGVATFVYHSDRVLPNDRVFKRIPVIVSDTFKFYYLKQLMEAWIKNHK
jgi:hypothetical protein